MAWGAFYFGGKYRGQLYSHDSTEEKIDDYIAYVHRSNDSITLQKGPLYAKPVPAECVDVQESMVWLANALEQYAKGEVITVPSVTENEEEFFTWLKNQDLDSGAVSVDWPVVAHQYTSKALSGLAAAPSHSQQSAWRPIETAPKDGTEVIVRFVLNGDGFVEAKNASFNRGWKRICHSTKSQQYFSFGKVTHWIPIPDLPGRCPSHESEQHNQQTEGK